MKSSGDQKIRNLALIPARGGSKRIPNKNTRLFLGKPIIAYSIENALNTGLFEEVMVSTDNSSIAQIAADFGAKVPFLRSRETSGDFAILADVIREVILTYQKDGVYFDNVCCILATAPLINPGEIRKAYDLLISSEFISVYPVVKFSFPIMRSLEMEMNGSLKMKWPEYSTARSQDIPPAYHDSGSFYWHRTDLWMDGKRYAGGIIKEEITVQDIDTEQDWLLAEMKYKIINGQGL
jgi:pseudaminic acid cytidylyltransferase